MIELMIVIAVIGLLSVVLIPKVLPLKDAAKNNAVEANVLIARSFLENRAGADKINIDSSLKTDPSAVVNALNPIKDDIGLKMNTTFSGSSAMKNPFNNSTLINYTSLNAENSSVLVKYDVTSIPANVSSITSSVTNPGVTVIIVYRTGYVVYGVDNFGGIVKPTLINMPKAGATLPGSITNPLTPQGTAPNFNYKFDMDGGSYTLSCQNSKEIKYTIDGSEPNSTSSTYDPDVPIPVKSATTLKAYAIYSGLMDSNIVSTTFTPLITIPILTPSFSFSGNFGIKNIITKEENIIFSVAVNPSVLDSKMKMEITIDDVTSELIDINGFYSFKSPTEKNKVCTIKATLTKDNLKETNPTIANEEFLGQLVLTTDNN